MSCIDPCAARVLPQGPNLPAYVAKRHGHGSSALVYINGHGRNLAIDGGTRRGEPYNGLRAPQRHGLYAVNGALFGANLGWADNGLYGVWGVRIHRRRTGHGKVANIAIVPGHDQKVMAAQDERHVRQNDRLQTARTRVASNRQTVATGVQRQF